jgi:hypothetical protein
MRWLAIAPILFGCAAVPTPEPKGGPRGLRASEHMEAAQRHDASARERETWPDVRTGPAGEMREAMPMPWYRSWDTAGEHERIAAAHRAKAAELQAAFDEACGATPGRETTRSPLETFGIGGWNTATGVIVYLSPEAGAPDQLMAKLKCHRAAMMLAPSGMEDCPLDLPDIALDARGDASGITVSIVVRDPKLVPELQRRAAHDLEAAAQLRAKAH